MLTNKKFKFIREIKKKSYKKEKKLEKITKWEYENHNRCFKCWFDFKTSN